MEYIQPMFLLLFVLGIVAAVSSRHAAKHYPVEDTGNQDESSLVKKTLKRHGSSLTSAFDFGEEKNKRKVNSVTDMGDSPSYLKFDIYNPSKGSPLVPVDTNAVYLVYGNEVMELPDVQPDFHGHYEVEETTTQSQYSKGAAGVFTYYMSAKDKTLAVMFHRDVYTFADLANNWINVKLYDGSIKADQALYDKMDTDSKELEYGETLHYLKLGSGFGAHVALIKSESGQPMFEIDIEVVKTLI